MDDSAVQNVYVNVLVPELLNVLSGVCKVGCTGVAGGCAGCIVQSAALNGPSTDVHGVVVCTVDNLVGYGVVATDVGLEYVCVVVSALLFAADNLNDVDFLLSADTVARDVSNNECAVGNLIQLDAGETVQIYAFLCSVLVVDSGVELVAVQNLFCIKAILVLSVSVGDSAELSNSSGGAVNGLILDLRVDAEELVRTSDDAIVVAVAVDIRCDCLVVIVISGVAAVGISCAVVVVVSFIASYQTAVAHYLRGGLSQQSVNVFYRGVGSSKGGRIYGNGEPLVNQCAVDSVGNEGISLVVDVAICSQDVIGVSGCLGCAERLEYLNFLSTVQDILSVVQGLGIVAVHCQVLFATQSQNAGGVNVRNFLLGGSVLEYLGQALNCEELSEVALVGQLEVSTNQCVCLLRVLSAQSAVRNIVLGADRLAFCIDSGNLNHVVLQSGGCTCAVNQVVRSGYHNDGLFNAEYSSSDGLALDLCIDCVVEQLCDYFALNFSGVRNAGDAVKNAKLACLVDVAPGISACGIVEAQCTNDHNDRVAVGYVIEGSEFAAADTVNDSLLCCVAHAAQSFCIESVDVGEVGIICVGFPVCLVDTTGNHTSGEQRHLIALYQLVSCVTIGSTLVKLDSFQILDRSLVVRLASLCSEYCRNHAEDHQHCEHQRKNLFHLFLISL